jgi:hypothetical protein
MMGVPAGQMRRKKGLMYSMGNVCIFFLLLVCYLSIISIFASAIAVRFSFLLLKGKHVRDPASRLAAVQSC